MGRTLRNATIALSIVLFTAASASAVPFEIGTYILGNHPDGNARLPTYGFRLDNLYEDSAPFTFDFDCVGCDMKATYNGSSVRIFGTMFGGEHDGAGGRIVDPTTGFYNVNVTYNGTQIVEGGGPPGDGSGLQDIGILNGTSGGVNGIGELTFGTQTWLLQDKNDPPDHPHSFRLGNEDNDLGHRGAPGISGWGWVLIKGSSDDEFRDPGGAQDWLFTARRRSNETPVPGTAALLLLGMAALARKRRR